MRIFKEDVLAPTPSLGNMVREAGYDYSDSSGHTRLSSCGQEKLRRSRVKRNCHALLRTNVIEFMSN